LSERSADKAKTPRFDESDCQLLDQLFGLHFVLHLLASDG